MRGQEFSYARLSMGRCGRCDRKRRTILDFRPRRTTGRPFHLAREQVIESHMELPQDALLLRIFIGESDRWKHQPLYEAIVLRARERHLAGATVLRGPMSFGAASRIHTAKILRLSMDLPLVIEIVDSDEKINGFLPDFGRNDGRRPGDPGEVKVIHYRHERPE